MLVFQWSYLLSKFSCYVPRCSMELAANSDNRTAERKRSLFPKSWSCEQYSLSKGQFARCWFFFGLRRDKRNLTEAFFSLFSPNTDWKSVWQPKLFQKKCFILEMRLSKFRYSLLFPLYVSVSLSNLHKRTVSQHLKHQTKLTQELNNAARCFLGFFDLLSHWNENKDFF